MDTPTNRGYAVPQHSAPVSPAGGLVLAAGVAANPQNWELPVLPRRIFDQVDLRCCISCAIASALEARNAANPALAPLFHYYITRFDRNGADRDGNLYLDTAMQVLASNGVARNSLHAVPFTEAGAATRPLPSAYADAKTRATAKSPFQPGYSIAPATSRASFARDQLLQKRPVIVGFYLPEGYPKNTFLNASFEWLDPDAKPVSQSGHCVLLTGFSDLRGAFHVHDSQGPQHFHEGRWWMGYRILSSRHVSAVYSITT